MQIVSRAQWGAKPPLREPYRPPDPATEVFLHHTAGAHQGAAGMRSMQTYHQSADPSRDKEPWNDIAYNFVVDPHDFKVYEGRGWGVAPGAQKGHNVGTLAICVMGDFRSKIPSQGVLDVIANLIVYGHDLGHIPLVLTGGHRDAPGQSTSCPGQNLYSKIPAIRQLLEDDMPSIEEIRQAIRDETPGAVLGAQFGGPAGSDKRRSFAEHVLDIKSTVASTNKRVMAISAVGGASAGAIVTEIANRLAG
jgi:peptidoglycan recognition protein